MNTKFLIIIILVATVLRVWSLDSSPAGFNADEAAIGYNAYSLLKTGRDEYGTSFPLAFKSFGDFKPGLYFYFVMPFVTILGLNEWAVRLPSALLGVGTVVLIYFLAKRIFDSSVVGVVAALLLTISPWHLHFSRGGWETNAATFFITLGIYLFLISLEQSKYLFFSLLSFLVSMYLYQSPRLIVPVLLVVLSVLYFKKIKINFKKSILGIAVLVILSIPILMQFALNQGTARFSGLSFFTDPGPSSRVNQLRGQHQDLQSLSAIVLHNKLTAYGPNFLGHYLDHFDPNFLFINGDPIIRNKVPETGQFYLIESIFLILGLVFLIRSKVNDKKLIFFWLLIAPLASATTFQTPHALRALSMVIPVTLIIAFGLYKSIELLNKRWVVLTVVAVTIFLSFEFIRYLESYYIHYPKRYPLAWEYGFSQMVEKLGKYQGYQNIVITDRYDQPYILVLFYQKYDPAKYQPQAKLTERDKFNFGTVRGFDKYQFRAIDPKEVGADQDTLYIGTETEIPKNANILDKVDFPNGQPAFIFASQ